MVPLLLIQDNSGDGESDELEEEMMEEGEEEETRSQVTFETITTGADFLTPGGLNAFTVALPAKSERQRIENDT